MKQYSFLTESEQDNITYHIKNIEELDNNQVSQVCDLLNQIIIEDFKYQKKFGLNALENPDWSISTFKKFAMSKWLSKLFIAEDNGKICGLVWYYERPDTSEYKTRIGRVRFVVVDKKYRGLGISSVMMDMMKKWVKKNRPVSHLTIGVNVENQAANHLYTKFGFKPLHQNMVCKL